MTKVKKIKRLFLLGLISFLIVILQLSQVQAQEVYFSQFTEDLVTEEVTQPPRERLIQDSKKSEGLFTVYHHKSGKVYLELKPEQLNQDFLCFVTLESGLGASGIFSGYHLRDILFQFRYLQNKIQFVVPNINFRTQENDPQIASLNRSLSESVLKVLPILTIDPQSKNILIEIGDLFNGEGDLPGLMLQFSSVLKNHYMIDPSKSYISEIQTFPENVEIESVFGFSLEPYADQQYISTLPDNRSFNLKVRYSLLAVPYRNNYRPRLADERVGYFTTTYRNLSKQNETAATVRYINRWNLQKQDPNADFSPPVKPIKFWIENTVPLNYREAIREGILFWNQAFEKLGFINAIQVEQMPDNAPWNPADVRYNTIRWSTSFNAEFAGYGPIHINPLTGEILDADIIIESNLIRELPNQIDSFLDGNNSNTPELSSANQLCPMGLSAYAIADQSQSEQNQKPRSNSTNELCFYRAANQQLTLGKTALSLLGNVMANSPKMEIYTQQYLRSLIAHEVGHTLGLRHNFQGSTFLSPEELNNPEITQTQGLVSSIMDYVPVNLAPQGTTQGDYFPTQIGPYDQWVIQYGYQPIVSTTPQGEWQKLQEIAKRSIEPQLAYGTDEDLWDFIDPATNTTDLSNNMLQYSQWQFDNAIQMWKRLEKYTPPSGEGSNKMLRMFNTIFNYYTLQTTTLMLYIGGQSFTRIPGGGASSRLPFEPIPIEKQRQALKLLETYVFNDRIFNFSPNLLNQLAPARWLDWANPDQDSDLGYPIFSQISRFQRSILRSVLSPTRLFRLRELELKTTANNALTLPELFETLQNGIWTEILAPNGTMEISSIRRSLQREHLDILSNMVLGKIAIPEDAETLAWYQLKQLNNQLANTLKRNKNRMNAYTLAHVEQTNNRIQKVLESEVISY
ncbi:MAG: peptidase M43 [Oscillatoriales cyanobacterium CG2_30_40_61]|nr:MAG: peptidase M43 [Oscillatoriales cyanobacterium CG2_30_40_61]